MHRLPIRRQPGQREPENAGGEIGHPFAGQQQKAAVIRDQIEPLPLQRRRPANPAIAAGTFECGRGPAHEGQPQAIYFGNVAETAPHQGREPQVVVRAHQPVPLAPFVRTDQAYAHAGDINGRGRENRGRHAGRDSTIKLNKPVPRVSCGRSVAWIDR